MYISKIRNVSLNNGRSNTNAQRKNRANALRLFIYHQEKKANSHSTKRSGKNTSARLQKFPTSSKFRSPISNEHQRQQQQQLGRQRSRGRRESRDFAHRSRGTALARSRRRASLPCELSCSAFGARENEKLLRGAAAGPVLGQGPALWARGPGCPGQSLAVHQREFDAAGACVPGVFLTTRGKERLRGWKGLPSVSWGDWIFFFFCVFANVCATAMSTFDQFTLVGEPCAETGMIFSLRRVVIHVARTGFNISSSKQHPNVYRSAGNRVIEQRFVLIFGRAELFGFARILVD